MPLPGLAAIPLTVRCRCVSRFVFRCFSFPVNSLRHLHHLHGSTLHPGNTILTLSSLLSLCDPAEPADILLFVSCCQCFVCERCFFFCRELPGSPPRVFQDAAVSLPADQPELQLRRTPTTAAALRCLPTTAATTTATGLLRADGLCRRHQQQQQLLSPTGRLLRAVEQRPPSTATAAAPAGVPEYATKPTSWAKLCLWGAGLPAECRPSEQLRPASERLPLLKQCRDTKAKHFFFPIFVPLLIAVSLPCFHCISVEFSCLLHLCSVLQLPDGSVNSIRRLVIYVPPQSHVHALQ